MSVEYIDGKKTNGIKYDHQVIKKLYAKLKVPKTFWSPLHLLDTNCKYDMILSERARGKTTNLLLMGLCFFWEYGTQIQYIRSRENMIAKNKILNLFDTIVEYKYIEKLTGGKYNNVHYASRRFYLCHKDEDGEITDKMETQFFTALCVEKNQDYKSSYDTGGKGDFIVFDEFIGKYYYPNEFVDFCDLLSTIIRKRRSAMIFMLANTLSKTSPYFREMMITREIDKISRGQDAYIQTPKGTRIYVEMLGAQAPQAQTQQTAINTLYFGFDNELLVSITGDADWALYNYPHTPQSDDYTVLDQKHYLEYNNKLLRLEFCIHELTLFVNVHLATRTYSDSIIYNLDFDLDKNHRYGFGFDKGDKLIWDLYKKNLFTYADNTIGELVESYVKECRKGGLTI